MEWSQLMSGWMAQPSSCYSWSISRLLIVFFYFTLDDICIWWLAQPPIFWCRDHKTCIFHHFEEHTSLSKGSPIAASGAGLHRPGGSGRVGYEVPPLDHRNPAAIQKGAGKRWEGASILQQDCKKQDWLWSLIGRQMASSEHIPWLERKIRPPTTFVTFPLKVITPIEAQIGKVGFSGQALLNEDFKALDGTLLLNLNKLRRETWVCLADHSS